MPITNQKIAQNIEKYRDVEIDMGVVSRNEGFNKSGKLKKKFSINDWLENRLIALGFINDKSCCSDFVAGKSYFNSIYEKTTGTGVTINGQKAPVTDVTSTTTVVLTTQDSGKVIELDNLTGATITLPAAASGLVFTFVSKISNTSNNYTIQGATSSDLMIGHLLNIDTDSSNAVAAWTPNGSSNYKIVSNATTTSMLKGSIVRLIGLGTNLWEVDGVTHSSGVVATPFAG